MSGLFIVFEGPDGAGTTSHSKFLAERLEKEGHSVLLTTEPSDGPIGQWVRELLKSGQPVPPASLQLLFTADRAWHCANVIEPALKEGKIVLCDRYSLSTIIYGSAQGLSKEWLESLNNNFIQPDHQLLLLPPYEVCRERIGRRKSTDMFEEDSFQQKVYDLYTAYGKTHPEIFVIDTSGEKDVAREQIYSLVTLWIKEHP